MDECEKIGRSIREAREKQGLSQDKFALMIGMDQTYLSRIEQGKRNPTIKMLAKIARGLGVDVRDLIDF